MASDRSDMSRASVDGQLRRKGLAPPGAFAGKVVWITGASQVTARTLCSRSGSWIFMCASPKCVGGSPALQLPCYLPPIISAGSRGRAGGSIRGARREACAVRPPRGCAPGAHSCMPGCMVYCSGRPSIWRSWRLPPPGASSASEAVNLPPPGCNAAPGSAITPQQNKSKR